MAPCPSLGVSYVKCMILFSVTKLAGWRQIINVDLESIVNTIVLLYQHVLNLIQLLYFISYSVRSFSAIELLF